MPPAKLSLEKGRNLNHEQENGGKNNAQVTVGPDVDHLFESSRSDPALRVKYVRVLAKYGLMSVNKKVPF